VERRGTVARKHANAAKIAELRALLKQGADLSHLNFLDLVEVEELAVAPGEPLRLQAEDFIDAIRTGRRPLVNAEDGFAAVRTAERIVAAARAAGSRML
jgi:predicted dehydrogenase